MTIVKKTLAIPTVHLNGTSREALIEQLCEAIDAVHAAGSKLAAACPQGRDYYPQGAEATSNAMREHEARMLKLKCVADELQTIAEALWTAAQRASIVRRVTVRSTMTHQACQQASL